MIGFSWSDHDVRQALGLARHLTEEGVSFTGVSTDSRTITPGQLYVALVGERFDGHDFLAEAVARGAGGAVLSHQSLGNPLTRIYPVPDTLAALGQLARYRREATPLRVVAITGSSGKTTTKELVRAALASSFRVHATRGNLNNRIGLPLTILAAPVDAELLVLELGTSEPGEIEALTRIALPDLVVITTVGDAHLEGLGSREGIFREKLSILNGLTEGGAVVVGDEPAELAERVRGLGHEVRVVGLSERADPDLRAARVTVGEDGGYRFDWEGERVELRTPGIHGARNALIALAVARQLGASAADAARGVSTVEPIGMRGETRRIGSITLVLDCYNANPQSVEAALDHLAVLPEGGGRVAVLGSMLELGPESPQIHRRVLESALSRPFRIVVATGDFERAAVSRADADIDGVQEGRETAAHGMPEAGAPDLLHAPDLPTAYALLRQHLQGDEVILLKGSRGAAMEALIPLFERDFGGES